MESFKTTPILVPMDLEAFWGGIRIIIKEEIGKLNAYTPTNNKYQTPAGLVEKPLYRIAEICDLFQITRPTLYEWIKDGRLTPRKIRSKVFFLAPDVNRLLKE